MLRKDLNDHVQKSMSKHLIIMYQQQMDFQQEMIKRYEKLEHNVLQFKKEQDKKWKSIHQKVCYALGFGYQVVKTLEGHSNSVYELKAINSERFISCSGDKTLKIWKSTGEFVQTLKGHTASVNAIAILSNRNIVSGSSDKTMKFWKPDGFCFAITHVGDAVWSLLELRDGRIACGCWDAIFIYNSNGSKVLKTLKGHRNRIRSIIQLKNGFLVSGSIDSTIKIWNIEQEKCVSTITDHAHSVVSLCLLEKGGFASASTDKTIKIRNDSGKCLKVLQGHTYGVTAVIELKNGNIASGSSDNTVKIWDVTDGKCLQTLSEHSDFVFALAELKEGVLVSGSKDTTIVIWHHRQ